MFGVGYKPSSVLLGPPWERCTQPPSAEQPSSLIYALRSPAGYVSVLPLGIGRATLHTADILELATRRWYCPRSIATRAVGSYPAFSPLPAE